MDITVRIEKRKEIGARMVREPPFSVRMENVSISQDGAEEYEGVYTILSSAEEQTLETKNKKMTEDLQILPIPTFEVENQAGGKTFIIGG